MSYIQITPFQVNEIAVLKRAGVSQKEIARLIGVTPSAISQEISRNKDLDGVYRARTAKQKRRNRRISANGRFQKMENSPELRKYAEKGLRSHWSPEQIAGRRKIKFPDNASHFGKDTIYKWVYSERKDLVKYLRCKKGSYRRRYGTRIREKAREASKIKRIDTRPSLVETRERIGDWEGDTVIGKERTKRLVTNVERKSGYGLLNILQEVTAEKTRETLQKKFSKISKRKKHAYAYDNGTKIGTDWFVSSF